MRRRLDVRWRLRRADFLRMQKRQLDLIDSVAGFLKRGGTLVYSTCSLEPEENEGVVQQLLARKSILQLEEQKQCVPFQDHLDGAFAAKFLKAV